MTVKFPEVWDLDTLFPGGSGSQELRLHMDEAVTKLSEFEELVQKFEVPAAKEDAPKVADLLERMSHVMRHLSQSGAFIGCLMAQNTQDKKAGILESEASSLSARFQNSFQKIQQDLSKTQEDVWAELLNEELLREFTFVLNEWREEAKMLLSEKEESLITALSIDGYHSWSQLYDMLVGEINVTVTVDGEPKVLSVGQANNLSSHKDAGVRKESYEKLEEAWTEKEEFFAKTIEMMEYSGVDLEGWLRGFDNVEESVAHSVNMVRHHPLLDPTVPVHGLVIDPTTGKLDVVINGNENR